MNLRQKIFMTIFIITILASFFIRSPLSVVPLLYLLLSILVSYIYLLIIKNNCEVLVDCKNKTRFIRNSKEQYRILIRNKSILIFPILKFTMELQDEDGFIFDKHEDEFILNSKDKKNLNIDIVFPHIGKYFVRILKLEIFGIFNIFSLKYDPEWEEEIFIEPKIYNISDYDFDSNLATFEVEFATQNKIDGEIYDDIREYVQGDPIKNIHWKLSAHANEYMTRILKIDAISGVSIYLDFNCKNNLKYIDRAKINDAIIEIGYALGLYFIKNNRGINYIYSNNNIPISVSPRDVFELKQYISSFPKFSNKELYDLELLLTKYSNGPNSMENIFIISNNISRAIIATMLDIQNKGKRVIFCLVGEHSNEDIQILKEIQLEYFIVESAKEFVDTLGGNKNE